ncbi:unnamed protein product [Prorocentrum cordatum]|uniref:non-specific serine/threonine protein kinase n=1 Tax=Prorocentrum cordatum TaxID=2364126 RepID=A0ABN9XS15_9DINO|nr:unnamed protein product [Polarella glacialis]
MWAIGVILYELMALRLPFRAESLLAVVYQIAFTSHDEAPLRDSGRPDPLVALVALLLSKEPSARPGAGDLLADSRLWTALSEEAAHQAATEACVRAQASSPARGGPDVSGLAARAGRPRLCVRGRPGGGEVAAAGRRRGPGLAGGGRAGGRRASGGSRPRARHDSGPRPLSERELWDELRRTRHDSDTVPLGRYDALLERLRSAGLAVDGPAGRHTVGCLAPAGAARGGPQGLGPGRAATVGQ